MDEAQRTQVTELLETIRGGDGTASDRLLALVYEDLRHLAAAIFDGPSPQHTLQPTALVHEAWLKMAGGIDNMNDRQHFFAVAARAMRQVLADHARSKTRAKRGGGARRVALDEDALAAPSIVDLLELSDALEELARLDERHARVVELRVLGGLTIPETARLIGVSESTVRADWRLVQAWLLERLEQG